MVVDFQGIYKYYIFFISRLKVETLLILVSFIETPSAKPWNEMLGHLGHEPRNGELETGKDIESLLCIFFCLFMLRF